MSRNSSRLSFARPSSASAVIIHQPVEHPHGRMALQLAVDIDLYHIAPFVLLDNLCQHQIGSGTGILFHAALKEFSPIVLLFRQMRIAFLQHRQRFADQLFIWLRTRCSDSAALA